MALPRGAVCNRLKGDDHDKCPQDHVGASLQALFIGGRDMRKRRSHNARRCRHPACSGSQNLTKCRQVSGLAKGRAEMQQLQAFHGPERLPDGRWNYQSGRLVHDLSESLTSVKNMARFRARV